MHAVIVRQFGGPDVLTLAELPEPTPAAGEVLVRLRAIGVNFADTERRRAVYDVPELPWTPGHEAAGEVIGLGAGVAAELLGQRVGFWSPRSSAGYAQLATVPAAELFRFPRALDWSLMAALPLQGLTAYGVVHRAARLRANETVLIHAAAGGVGQIAVQLARAAGARVLGTASSPAKRAEVRALGADALDYGPALVAQVREHTAGRGVDVVLDGVGQATQVDSLAALAPRGRLIFFGEASGPALPVEVETLYPRSLSVGAFMIDLDDDAPAWAQTRSELVAHVVAGTVALKVAEVIPMSQAARAHQMLEARQTSGKLVLDPDR
jgi:NADPH:quinone reductase